MGYIWEQLAFWRNSIFLFGDLNQLKPVSDRWFFQKSSDLGVPDVWGNFLLFEMDQIMRQRKDAKFALALTILALGKTAREENEMFESRELSKLLAVIFYLKNIQ